jgi:tetratricopeptide (TPR) repeat protein
LERAPRSGSFTHPQGLLAPEILVTKAELGAGDPDVLTDAVTRFCQWCIEEAGLVREEVQPDAWPIHHTSFYIAQVSNGGHGQFAANSAMTPEVLDDIDDGLSRLELDHLLSIFRGFRGALGRDPALQRTVVAGGGFGDIPDVICELDGAFHRSPDSARFHQQAARWLKAASTVLAVSPRELQERQRAIIASNGLLASRRAASTQRSPWARLTGAAARLWDRTGARRPGDSVLDQARRNVEADRPVAWQISDAQGDLIQQVIPAVRAGDDAQVDRIFAGFRDLHARYSLEASERWPEHLRMYASKLHYAGEQLGRCDLLEQAADAFGRGIATGASYKEDAGFDWRSLGQAFVALGRLDKRKLAGVAEAVGAFTRALAVDPPAPDVFSRRLRSLLGLAEAHLVLAAGSAGAGHLDAARNALDQARPLLGPDERWRGAQRPALALSGPPLPHVCFGR